MAQEIKTLVQVAEDIENGNNLREYYNNDGAQIKAGQFGSFADFISYYNQHYRPILQAIADGEDLTAQPAQLLRFMASDLLELFADTDEDTDSEDETDPDEDPTLTEAEVTEQREQTQTGLQSAESRRNSTESQKRDTLTRLWAAAWSEAQADPEGTRVIVETAEQDPSAPDNEFGRYYMIDGSEAESCIDHAGQWVVIRVDTVTSPYEVRRPNWAHLNGYADNCAQLCCRCENPNNIVRWAEKMINAGRVTDIYPDCY